MPKQARIQATPRKNVFLSHRNKTIFERLLKRRTTKRVKQFSASKNVLDHEEIRIAIRGTLTKIEKTS
jgi:hypothetical protein